MALSSYRYVRMLICTENAYHANTRRHRQEVALQIQEVAPTDSRGGPHHVCGVALCSVWHFALREMDSRGGPHGFKRWPHHVCGVALCSVWHLVPFRTRRTLVRLWDTSSSSRHQAACSAGRRYDCAINRVKVQGT